MAWAMGNGGRSSRHLCIRVFRRSPAHTGLDVVAVGVEDKSDVINHPLRPARPRRAVVDAAGIQCGGVEPVDRRAILRGEGTWIGAADVLCAAVQKAGSVLPTQMKGSGSSALRPTWKNSPVLSMVARPSALAQAS